MIDILRVVLQDEGWVKGGEKRKREEGRGRGRREEEEGGQRVSKWLR